MPFVRVTLSVTSALLLLSLCGCDNLPLPPAEAPPAVEQAEQPRPPVERTDDAQQPPHDTTTDTDRNDVIVEKGNVQVEKAKVKPYPDAPSSFAGLVERVQPAVVNVYTEQIVSKREMRVDPMYGRYTITRPERMESLGSGFIIDEEGFILTNTHVIKGASTVKIVTLNGEKHDAQIVGTDPLTDIALLKIEPYNNMRVLPLGDADTTRVGDWLMAVGNPFGLQSTVTTGILSARGRHNIPVQGDIRYIDFLQTDASINPGNSGGPLIAMDGTVVGINTAVKAGGQGIGFAIPINMAKSILDDLRQGKKVARSWLGISVADIPEEFETERRKGVFVQSIVRGGPANVAGIQPGDIIVKFGDQPLEAPESLPWLSSTAGVGTTVAVQVDRKGELLDIPVVMGKLPY